MGFASGPVSFQRFLIDGSMPANVTERFVRAVNDHAFGRLAMLPDDTQLGWIGPNHLFETDIAAESIACGPYVHLAVRVDRLKAPPSVIRAYVQVEEQAMLQAKGREFLNRGEKRQARERALGRADQETRAGTFRRMNAYPLLIDAKHRTVFLGTLSATVADKVMQLFYDTFGRGLEPADPERLATRILDQQQRTRTLEGLAPFTLVKPPDGLADSASVLSETDLCFLGKEFLTWLWCQTESDDGPLRVSAGDEVTVLLDRTLRLKCDFGVTGTDVITADNPTSLPEAKAALRIGKQPTRAGLILGSPHGEFRFTLDGPRLAVSGLVLPEDETSQNGRARQEQRFELIADAAHLLDALFELFVLRRTARGWSRDLQALSAWAAGRDRAKLRPAVSA